MWEITDLFEKIQEDIQLLTKCYFLWQIMWQDLGRSPRWTAIIYNSVLEDDLLSYAKNCTFTLQCHFTGEKENIGIINPTFFRIIFLNCVRHMNKSQICWQTSKTFHIDNKICTKFLLRLQFMSTVNLSRYCRQ